MKSLDPELIQLRKGFGRACKQRGSYPGGRGRAYKRNKKTLFKTSHGSVDQNTFFPGGGGGGGGGDY